MSASNNATDILYSNPVPNVIFDPVPNVIFDENFEARDETSVDTDGVEEGERWKISGNQLSGMSSNHSAYMGLMAKSGRKFPP